MRPTKFFSTITAQLEHYSGFQPLPLSIKKFIDFGKDATERQSFVFMRQEVLVRLANIMKEIQCLPPVLLRQPGCREVIDLYGRSFSQVCRFHKADPDQSSVLDDFRATLRDIRHRHVDVVRTMAEGVMQMKEDAECKRDVTGVRSIPYFLDRFYMNRISIRMLINQHTLLFSGEPPLSPHHIGCFDEHCNVVSVLKDAAADARFLCERYYLTAPEVQIEEQNKSFIGHNKDRKPPIELVYVPSHLHHILFELLKNAMRAVAERHGEGDLPPVKVLVSSGDEDVTIKISDLGGGVSRSVGERLFDYMFSTAPPPSSEVDDAAPMAGYGYGLPLSRLYAKYLQGDLNLVTCEGYGMDAIVYIKSLAKDAKELLPVYGRSCRDHYENGRRVPLDWSSYLGSSGSGCPRERL